MKIFSRTGDIQTLANNLNKILKLDYERVLIEEIKPFIPARHLELFDTLTKHNHHYQQPPQVDNHQYEIKQNKLPASRRFKFI